MLPPVAHGDQPFTTNVRPRSGTVADTFTFTITMSGSTGPIPVEPEIEESSEFLLVGNQVQQQHSILNGKVTSSTSYVYDFQPSPDLKPGVYRLPQARVQLGNKNISLERPLIELTKAPAKPKESSEGVRFEQTTSTNQPYVGEQVYYQAELSSRYKILRYGMSDVEFKDIWHESFGKAREGAKNFGSTTTRTLSELSALFPVKAGEITIPARSGVAEIELPKSRSKRRNNRWDPFSERWPLLFDFDNSPREKRRAVASEIALNVKPLPTPPKTGLEYIPVGKIKLASAIDRNQLKRGDGLTMTIELYGDANLKPYELPKLSEKKSRDFKIYPDEPELERFVGTKKINFKKKFTIALVPQRVGKLELPQFTIVTFNPVAEEYKLLKTRKRTIKVLPNDQEDKLVIAGNQTGAKTVVEQEKQPVIALGEDLRPQHIGPQTLVPRRRLNSSLVLSILIGLPLLMIAIWFGYARKFAVSGDPLAQQQREAAKNLENSLEECSRLDGESFLALLSQSLQRYLGEKFRRPQESLTPMEAATLLKSKIDDEAAETARSTLTELEAIRFGGDSNAIDETLKRELMEKTRTLMKTIEDRVR